MGEFKLQSSKWSHEWNFPSDNGIGGNGLSSNGVETFRGEPIISLAREICQNSIDAGLDIDNGLDQGRPVRVEFHAFDASPDEIPRFDQLQFALHAAMKFWDGSLFNERKPGQPKNKKTVDFLEKALKIAEKDKIHCLRISDFNTKGLTGSNQEYGSNWSNLTKATGTSGKEGSSGGSYGIGKDAAYVCSALRTLIYSTADKDGLKAWQGVSHLMNFSVEDDVKFGTGFYGEEGNHPIPEQFFLDPDFKRSDDQTGTDIYIIGFNENSNWKDEMVKSVLDGFLYAVWSGKLIVDVQDIQITKDSLAEIIEQYKPYKQNADQYYQVLTADEKAAPTIVKDIDNLGNVKLKLLFAPNLCRKVAMVRRTGMKIFDQDRINANISFAGLLYIEGEKLNSYLRAMENPQHTKWEPDRAEDKKQYCESLRKKIVKFIHESFDKQKLSSFSESLDPSVGQFLSVDDDGKQTKKDESLNDEIKNVSLKVHKVLTTNTSLTASEEQVSNTIFQNDPEGNVINTGDPGTGTGHGEGTSTNHHGNGFGTDDGDGNGQHPKEQTQSPVSISPEKCRLLCRDKHAGLYRIIFTPSKSARDCSIEVLIAAESQDYGAEIASAQLTDGTHLSVDGSRVKGLTFEKGKTITIDINLGPSDGYFSMEVRAYGYQV